MGGSSGSFSARSTTGRTLADGGSVQARCRLALEIGAAIRAAVGDDYPIGIALTFDECIGPDGHHDRRDDPCGFAVLARRPPVFDFFDLSIGASRSGSMTMASMTVPENHAFAAAASAKRVVGGRARPCSSPDGSSSVRMAAQAVAAGGGPMSSP